MQHTLRSFCSQSATVCTLQTRSAKMTGAPHSLADKQFTRYFFRECPRGWECTQQAWKRAKYCESYEGEHEARSYLLNHLVKSGNHRHNDHWKLWDSAQKAELEVEYVSGKWFKEAPGPAVGEEVDSPLFSIQCTGDSRNGIMINRQLRWTAC